MAAARPCKDEEPASVFLDKGFVVQTQSGLSTEQTRQCRKIVYRQCIKAFDDVSRLGMTSELHTTGFVHFKTRQRLRYDLEMSQELKHLAWLGVEAPWRALVEQILGKQCRLAYIGVMLSLPGSETQAWHSDGDHIRKDRHHKPHCINIFVPLIQTKQHHGGTELAPGTHRLGHYDDAVETTTPLLKIGDYLAFDFRLRHRGLRNCSQHPRPLLYLQYCAKGYDDHMNFSTKRYFKLPDLPDKPEPRSDRLKKKAKRSSERFSGDSGNGSDTGDESSDFDITDDEEEESDPHSGSKHSAQQQKQISLQRRKHKRAARLATKLGGIAVYNGAPVIALDVHEGLWYPSQIYDVDPDDGYVRVHFRGWPKQFDFTCTLPDATLVRSCPADVLLDLGGEAAMPVDPIDPRRRLTPQDIIDHHKQRRLASRHGRAAQSHTEQVSSQASKRSVPADIRRSQKRRKTPTQRAAAVTEASADDLLKATQAFASSTNIFDSSDGAHSDLNGKRTTSKRRKPRHVGHCSNFWQQDFLSGQT